MFENPVASDIVSECTCERLHLLRGFSQWQAAQGRKGGTAKGRAYEEQRAKAQLMRASGMTYDVIAAESGTSKRQAIRWAKAG